MTIEELTNKIAELKEEQRSIVEKAETEKRQLTEDEKINFEIFDEEKQNLIKELDEEQRKADEEAAQLRDNLDNNKEENKTQREMTNKEKMAIAFRAIANNKNDERVADMVAGNTISLRASGTTVYDDATAGVENYQSVQFTELIEPLQAALIVDQLGIKVITTNQAVVMPSVSNVEATVEGETTALVGQKLEFSKAKVEPFRVGLSLPFSNTAIKQADINLVSYAVDLCGKAEGHLINKIMFNNAAVSGKKGAFVDAYAAETSTTTVSWKALVKLAGKVKQNNVIFDGTEAYVMSPEMEAELKSTPKDAGSGLMVIENGLINGYPYMVSSDVEGYIGFGVFSNYLIQRVGTPDMVIDNLSRSKENITEVNFNDNVAMQVVRSEAFAAIKVK